MAPVTVSQAHPPEAPPGNSFKISLWQFLLAIGLLGCGLGLLGRDYVAVSTEYERHLRLRAELVALSAEVTMWRVGELPITMRWWCDPALKNRILNVHFGRHPKDIVSRRFPSIASAEKIFRELGELDSLTIIEANYTDISHESIAALALSKSLQHLRLSSTCCNDDDVAELAKISTLRTLTLSQTHVTDRAIDFLAELPELEVLGLGYTTVSDSSIEKLSQMPSLRDLDLGGTNVTEKSVETLGKMTHLKRLDASYFSSESRSRLRELLPSTEIE